MRFPATNFLTHLEILVGKEVEGCIFSILYSCGFFRFFFSFCFKVILQFSVTCGLLVSIDVFTFEELSHTSCAFHFRFHNQRLLYYAVEWRYYDYVMTTYVLRNVSLSTLSSIKEITSNWIKLLKHLGISLILSYTKRGPKHILSLYTGLT